ncbi:uracil-DNA glycosylase family protein [Thiolapillus brandeum]|uniref:Uracil-DNA glycosylase n=1 Tax=Thiolapillus brandeum TaxID=1076588 RepID=A0A7U6GG60_9GAMM|nr:uracil-DNA glycosylase family protein [Thiolapillus brandeum]BAO43021.1 uracil-DNA glycosylase [Thiolapillus brandeum]
MKDSMQAIVELQSLLRECRCCKDMIPPVVVGRPVVSPVISIGQAPGDREGLAGKPFAWTAGKTLFKWFATLGVDEESYRSRVYMAAVCRCFPGKNPKGGDRVPNQQEIAACSAWLEQEFSLLQPRLVIPVGKLAIARIMPVGKLTDVVGRQFEKQLWGVPVSVIPLPHPSGVSTWHRTEPGQSLLMQALDLIGRHSAWQATFPTNKPGQA